MKIDFYRILVSFFFAFLFSILGLMLFNEYEHNDCDALVELKDGTVLAGSAINYYTNLGVIDVIGCDGRRKTIRTNLIKKITER